MATDTRRDIKVPGPLYAFCAAVCRLVCRLIFGLRVEYIDPVPSEGPVLVLGSHEGMLDSLFMAAAINRRLNFVTTERFFHIPGVGRLFRALGVIPRIQFQSDARSIAAMLKVTRRGGAVGLFPAGQTSMCGVPANMPPGIARLAKKTGATVVALNLHGSFFAKARFQSGFNRTRVQGQVRVLFTPQTLAEASEQAVYEAITQALDYDEYAWQARTGVTVKSSARARGYEKVLVRCPRCGERYQMTSQGNRLWCKSCGNAATVGRDMHLIPEAPDCTVYPTLLEWYRWQADAIHAVIDDIACPFDMETSVQLELYRGNRRYSAGQGRMFLDRARIGFEGTVDGKPHRCEIAHQNLFGMVSEVGVYIELYDTELGLVRLIPQQPLVVTEWKIAQEYLYARTLG